MLQHCPKGNRKRSSVGLGAIVMFDKRALSLGARSQTTVWDFPSAFSRHLAGGLIDLTVLQPGDCLCWNPHHSKG